jgi:hypothetical protein
MMRIWAIGLFALLRASSGSAQPLVCRHLPTQPIQVVTAADAIHLTELAVCPGAQLTAVWHGSVALSAPIIVGNDTSLSISAAPSSTEVVHVFGNAAVSIPAASGSTEGVIDGKDATQLFQVLGELQLIGLTLQNGKDIIGDGGGAVYAAAKSRITSQGCTFKQNSADYGAAIISDTGAIVWLQEVSSILST